MYHLLIYFFILTKNIMENPPNIEIFYCSFCLWMWCENSKNVPVLISLVKINALMFILGKKEEFEYT